MNGMMLQFPGVLRRLRLQKGTLQKTIAHHLGIDPAQLCAIEKGSRGPLDSCMLDKVADLLDLNEQELQELVWAAHHDRLVGLLTQRGASLGEVELVSASLEAWHYMQAEQRPRLISSVRRFGVSAKVLASMPASDGRVEGFA